MRFIGQYFFEDIEEGMTASFAKTITEADIVTFAGVSGDFNPVHIDEDYARETMFKGRIAHGMLSASLISTVFGTKLPGPGCVYVSQNLRFRAPVKIGDTVTAQVRVTGRRPDKRLVMFDTVCRVGEKDVLTGDAALMVPSREQG